MKGRASSLILRIQVRAVADKEVCSRLRALELGLLDVGGVDQRGLSQLVLDVEVELLLVEDDGQHFVVLDRDMVDGLALCGRQLMVRVVRPQEHDSFLKGASIVRSCRCSRRRAAQRCPCGLGHSPIRRASS